VLSRTVRNQVKLIWRIFIVQENLPWFHPEDVQEFKTVLRKMKPRHNVDTMQSSSSEVKEQNRTKTFDSIEPSFL
jgi:hypothetical protein